MSKILLEEMSHKHMAKVVEWRNSPRVHESFFSCSPSTLASQSEWLAKHTNKLDEKNFVITLNESSEEYSVAGVNYIGAVSLYNIDTKNREAEFGRFYIGEDSMLQKGYGGKAVELVLKYAFESLQLNKVYLEVFCDNPLAIKLYEDMGFTKEAIFKQRIYNRGEFKDILRMCIFKGGSQ